MYYSQDGEAAITQKRRAKHLQAMYLASHLSQPLASIATSRIDISPNGNENAQQQLSNFYAQLSPGSGPGNGALVDTANDVTTVSNVVGSIGSTMGAVVSTPSPIESAPLQ